MDPVESARDMLPWWVRWGPLLVHPPITFVVSLAATFVAALVGAIPAMRKGDAHWSERARRVWPARIAVTGMAIASPVLCGAYGWLQSEHAGRPDPWDLVTSCAAASLVGCAIVVLEVGRRLRAARIPIAAQARSVASVLLLRYRHLFLAAVAAAVVPPEVSWVTGLVLVLVSAVLVWSVLASGLGLARLLGLASPAPPDLGEPVKKLAAEMGVTLRGVWTMPWAAANALAYPVARQVVFTERALDILDDGEIRAIAVHEIGHVSEPRGVKLARASTLVVVLAIVAAKPLGSSWGLPVVVATLLGAVVFVLLVRILASRLERRADGIAAERSDPVVYARALEKIYEANLVPAVLPRRGIHGHLWDRMKAAGAEPDWPRPRPPSRVPTVAGLVLGLVVLGAVLAPLLAMGAP